MTSHELARLLLAHRDNDIQFIVLVEGDEDTPPRRYRVDRYREAMDDGSVGYDGLMDVVIVEIGPIYVGTGDDEA